MAAEEDGGGGDHLAVCVQMYAIRWHTAMTLAMFLALFTAGVNLHGAESLS